MTVDTRRVTGRRELHFHTLDDILADVEQLASGPVRSLGNWSLGQTCKHLAMTMTIGIDGASYRPAWYIRWLGPFFKKRFITRPMQPGFKLPTAAHPEFVPPEGISTEHGVTALRTAIHRLETEPRLPRHVILGPITPEEFDQLQMRHAEMHLSFHVPASSA